jgi:TonB family protein
MKSAVLSVIGVVLLAAASPAQEIPPYKPGGQVTMPSVISEVKPSYNAEAMRARIQGIVKVEVVVQPDGTVGDVRILQGLDPLLDPEAIAAVKKWRFKPGMKDGVAVPVAVEIELTFTIRSDAPGPKVGSAEALKPGNGVTAPRVLSEVKPEYPPAIKVKGVQGTVVLDCVVLPSGRVGDVRVATPLEPSLDEAAIRALRLWRFEPGMKDGKGVPVQVSAA